MLETEISPPVNPLALKINLLILKYVREQFFKKYLPNYLPVITSDLRSADHNADLGGAVNSAHLHGLAEDFTLTTINGQAVPEIQAKAAYDQIIAPNWSGFSEWEPSSSGKGYHIHINLSREISIYSAAVGLLGLGVVGYAILKGWGQNGIKQG